MKLRFFLCLVFLIVSLVMPLSVREVKAEEPRSLDIQVEKSYYFLGETCNITVASNSSDSVQLLIFNPSDVPVLNETVSPNATVAYVIPFDAEYGTYTVKCESITTWFWLQKIDDLVPISVPYSWNWKNIGYTLLANYTLQVEGFDGSLNIDWLSEVQVKFKPTVTVFQNDYLVLVKTKGKDIDADHWLMLQHSGLKIRINGTVASPTTLKWNFKNLGTTQVAWILSGLKVGHLVYDWSDFDRTGVSYEWDKTNLKCNVYLSTSFDVDPAIFEDGFESGLVPPWDGTTTSGTATIAIATDQVHHGINSSKSSVGASEVAYCYKNFGDNNLIYARIYIRFDNLIGSDWCKTAFIRIRDANNARSILTIQIYHTDPRWRIIYRSAGGLVAVSDADSPPTADEWRCIEVKVDCSTNDGDLDGSYEVFVDGVSIWSISGIDTDSITVDYLAVGVIENNDGSGNIFWVDCVVVDSSYIGPEAAGEEYSRSASQGLSISLSASRTFEITRTTTQAIGFGLATSRVPDFVRAVTQAINVALDGERLIEITRQVDQALGISIIGDRLIEVSKSASQAITVGLVGIGRIIGVYYRGASLGLTFIHGVMGQFTNPTGIGLAIIAFILAFFGIVIALSAKS